MVTVDIRNPNLKANVEALRELQKMGRYLNDELQLLYTKQI